MQQILLVEDDLTIALGLSYSLEQEGYAVTVCHDAACAQREIQICRFDLVLLDVSLPDGNGHDICRAVKADSDTPVIFLTVYNEETDVVKGLDMGADDYVAKPFRLKELLSRVRTVLRRAGGGQNDEISIGGLTINIRQAKAVKNGVEISLTALEYRLLLTLAQNFGQLLTRNRLLEDILGYRRGFCKRQHPHGLHQASARENRGRPAEPRPDPDGARSRLQDG